MGCLPYLELMQFGQQFLLQLGKGGPIVIEGGLQLDPPALTDLQLALQLIDLLQLLQPRLFSSESGIFEVYALVIQSAFSLDELVLDGCRLGLYILFATLQLVDLAEHLPLLLHVLLHGLAHLPLPLFLPRSRYPPRSLQLCRFL